MEVSDQNTIKSLISLGLRSLSKAQQISKQWVNYLGFTTNPQNSFLHTENKLYLGISTTKIYLQCRRHRFTPWVRKIPRRRKWQPTPVFLPGISHRQRSLVGYSPWGRRRVRHSWTTKQKQRQRNISLPFWSWQDFIESGFQDWG